MSSDWDSHTKGWSDLREFNIRQTIENVEAELGSSPLSKLDKRDLEFLSMINALREGLLQVEQRLDRLEEK